MNIKIGNRKIKYPIIQGGMGVGISLGNLSGAVAKEGCMGVISTVGIGYREDDFYRNMQEANRRAFSKEVRRARELAGGNGLIGANIMASLNAYKEDVLMAVEEKVDFIISGAGLALNLPELVGDSDILICPIVSSLKALRLIIKSWDKRYKRLPDFLVVEGRQAGGHLGFKREKIEEGASLKEISREIIDYLREKGLEIPIFVAGSVYDGYDLKSYRNLGATGIQLATRFIATEECDAHINFKQVIVDSSREDLVIIDSPAGLPARAVNNDFIRSLKNGKIASKRCINCLKTCNPKTTDFCISDALIESVKGNVESGLVFAGSNIDRINEIVRVKDIISSIVEEFERI